MRNLEFVLRRIHLVDSQLLIIHLLVEGTGLWSLISSLHATLPARAGTLSISSLGLRLDKASSFDRSVSRQIHCTVSASGLLVDDGSAFIGDKFYVGPVPTLQFGEHKHSLVTDFECPYPRYLLEVRACLIVILDQVVVQIKMQVIFGDLIFHYNSIGNIFNDCSSLFLEKVNVLAIVKTRVPRVLLGILTALDDKDNLFTVHDK